MSSPLVSVLVPNYNHAQFLEQRIDSVLAQTFSDYEVILLDDASTDGGAALLDKYENHPRVTQVVKNPKNSGSPFAQWMKGISLAKGKYIWIAESDDFCDPDFLSVAVTELQEGRHLFYAKSERVDESGKISGNMNDWYRDISASRWMNSYRSDSYNELQSALFYKNTIVNASAVVFRNDPAIQSWLQECVGMRYCGDWLFWLMYLSHHESVSYSVDVTNYFRFHANVSRKVHSEGDRDSEVLKVLDYILESGLSDGNESGIVRYFFANHLYIAPRKAVGRNFGKFFRQSSVSLRFIGCWIRYYLTGRKG